MLEPEGDEVEMNSQQRLEVVAMQVQTIRSIIGSIQINLEEVMEDGQEDDEFLGSLYDFVGEFSLGTYDYVDEDGFLEGITED